MLYLFTCQHQDTEISTRMFTFNIFFFLNNKTSTIESGKLKKQFSFYFSQIFFTWDKMFVIFFSLQYSTAARNTYP